jgi:AraC-like DNA-binding protein
LDVQRHVGDLRVARAFELITRQYADPHLDLSTLARAMNLSRGRASRLLKAHGGQRFLDALHAVRTRAAAQLLAHSTLSVKEVAAAVGYRRSNELIRHFRKAYSATPGAYRRQLPATVVRPHTAGPRQHELMTNGNGS